MTELHGARMRTNVHPPRGLGRTRVRGVTLISLMVGLVISSLAVVAGMMTYRGLALQSGSVREDSATDDQQTAALMRAYASVLDAGYGITTPAAPSAAQDVLLRTGAALSASGTLTGTVVTTPGTQANAVVWDFMDGATRKCAGLLAPADGGLLQLAPVACTGVASATLWIDENVQRMVAGNVVGHAQSGVNTQRVVRFRLLAQTCKPYGVGSRTASTVLELEARNSDGTLQVLRKCLLNLT